MDASQQPQQALDPQALQKFMQLMATKGGPASQMAPQGPQAPSQQTPGRVGQTPNVMTPPNIVWDPKTAIGNQPAPAAQQSTGAPQYQQDPSMASAMMAHLDPKGAATYSAIQGIGQFLGQLDERKQKNQASEAANLASSLMTAIDNKDMNGMIAIMGDPKKMKVINKVYKGWIQQAEQQAEEAAKPQKQEPKDPDTEGFQQGMQQHIDKKMQKQQQMQQQQEAARRVQTNPQGTPTSIGGYLIPQAGPGQMMKNMTESAQAQYAKQYPESAIEGPMTPERIERMEKLKADVETAQSKALEAQGKLQTADQQTKTALVRYQTVIQQGQNAAQLAGFKVDEMKLTVQKAREELQKSLVQKDIASVDLQTHKETLLNTIMKGRNQQEKDKKVKGLPLKEQERLYSLDKADKLLDVMEANGTVSSSDVADLQAVFAAAGANTLSKALPGIYKQNAPSWMGGADEDTVKGIRSAVKSFREGIETAADKNFPGWREGKGASLDAKKDEPKPPAGSGESDDTEDEGDTEEIDLTAN